MGIPPSEMESRQHLAGTPAQVGTLDPGVGNLPVELGIEKFIFKSMLFAKFWF